MNKYVNAFLAGITIGILVAPRKGSDTRRRILDKLNDFNDIITDEEPSMILQPAESTSIAAGLNAPIAPLK